jgi:hypothetical protein
MKVKVTDIEKRVIALLDENSEILEERTVYGDETAEVKFLIRQLLPDAARAVLSEAALSDIDEVSSIGSPAVSFGSDGRGVMTLPDDYLRLVSFRMSDWTRSVTIPMDATGDVYALRCSSRMSDRLKSPGVAVIHSKSGRTLEIFGSSSDATVALALYVAMPTISDGVIHLPSALVSTVEKRTAEMVREVIEN